MSDLLARLRIEADASTVAPTAARVEKALDSVRGTAQRTGAAMAGSEAGANRMASGLDRAGDQAQRFEQRTRGAAGGLGLLTGALGAAGIGAFVNTIQKAAFAAGGLELGLGAVTGGAANAATELAFVRQEAARLGLVAQDTAKDFLDLAASTNGTNLAGEQTRQIWLATAEAGMALGRSPEQIGRGLTALSQIAGKGVVSMEEVRQQLAEAIPGAVMIGARAMDMSSAAFNKLVSDGKLTSDVFLPKFAAQLREEFGPAIDDYLTSPLGLARQEMGKAETSLNTLRAAGGAGFLSGATEGLARLNAELGDAGTAARARDIGEALGQGAAIAADALVAVIDHLDEIAIAAQVVAGVGLVRFLTSTALAAQQAAAAYIVKGAAARSSALVAQQGLAAEGVALSGVRGAIVAAAQAEVAAAQAIRATALARELSAKAAYDEVKADLANVSSSSTLTQRRAALAVAETELTLARNASSAAAGRVAVAEAGQLKSLTGLGQAAGVAKAGMGGLLGLIGGPWGAAFLAAGAAVWVVTDALEDAKRRTAEAEANTRSYSDAMADSAAFLKEAADQSRGFGVNSNGAVGGTDALTGATARLTEQTWALANARAEANRQGLRAAYNALQEEKTKLEPNGFQQALQGANSTGALGIGFSGATTLLAPDTSARRAEITRQQADLAAREIALTFDPASNVADRPAISSNTAAGSSGKGKKDKAAALAKDLADERAAVEGHTAAVIKGEHALDLWRIAQAGADAVSRAGSESVRAQAEAVEKLTIADERIEQAASFARSATADTEALKRRAAASMLGQAALDELRVSEAGLAQLTDARVTSLDQLSGKEREQVGLAVKAAEAKERQAIATEKFEAAGKSVQQLDEEIAAEVRRQASIGKGIAAEVAYARAEFIRSEIERAGLKITDEAAQAIREKADALFRLQAVSDGSQAAADQERELRLMRLSNREREIAVRSETVLRNLLAQRLDLNEQEAKVVADKTARAQLEAEQTAQAIGRITGSLRDGFIKDGKLGMEQVGDYAEEKLRAAVYDAFLAKPIDIFVQATVSIANDLAKQIFGGDAGGGFISKIFGSAGGGIASMLGNAGIGSVIGSSMGLGSGNGLLDAGLAVGGSALGGMAGGALTAFAGMSSMFGSSIVGSIAGMLGPVMGPLGALAGLAIGSLFKDEKRPYTRADIVAQGGQFVVAGTQTADGGTNAVADQLGKAITDSLNAASKLFGIDVAKLEGLYTTAGYVEGGNYKALGGQGFFGGDIKGLVDYFNQAGSDLKGNTLGSGVSFDQVGSAEELATQVVRETILRAIAAGASDLSDNEKALVAASESLEEAITLIQTARGFGANIDDMLMQILDPAAFEKKKAIEAVEATYAALKAEAEKLIGAGLLSADTLDKIEQLKALQMDAALNGASGGATSANPFADAKDRLQSWLDGLAVSEVAPGGVKAQRDTAKEQYDRVLTLAQGGDRSALADLATYADRLLKADRQATGSAATRQVLYDQVTADVQRLIQRSAAEEPLNAAAISGPIIAALAGSQTALAQVLMTLPPETAAPLLEGILREPDWGTRLLGENVQVPPALQELADRVAAVAPGAATPIIAAVLAQPAWTVAMTAHLAGVQPSLQMVSDALGGLPPSVSGPIIQALALTPAWGASAVDYLQTLPPSLDLLRLVTQGLPAATAQPIIDALLQDPSWASGMLDQLQAIADAGGDPPDIAGPIVAALITTPAWGQATSDYLSQVGPSLELLGRITAGLPASTAQPIVDAILRDPSWAAGVLDQLQAIADAGGDPPDIAGPIIHALALTPQWGQQAIDYLKSLDPSLQLLRTVTSGLPASISGPIIEALLQDPAWTSALMAELSALLADPSWAAALQEAIGTDLTLSLDELGDTLTLLLALLGQGAVLPVPPTAPPVVETPVVRPPVIGGGGGGGGGGVLDDYGNTHTSQEWDENWRRWDQYTRDYNNRISATTLVSQSAYGIVESGKSTPDALGKVLDQQISALRTTFEQQMGDLLDATIAGFEAMSGASADQLDALRETASAQRVANAHLIAKATA